MDLQTKNLTDIHNDCVFIQGTASEVLEQMRVILPDLQKKISVDNCGTITNKDIQFMAVVDGLPVLSTLIDVSENLTNVVNALLK